MELCDKALPHQLVSTQDSSKIAERSGAILSMTPQRYFVLGASPQSKKRVQVISVGFSSIILFQSMVPMTMAIPITTTGYPLHLMPNQVNNLHLHPAPQHQRSQPKL